MGSWQSLGASSFITSQLQNEVVTESKVQHPVFCPGSLIEKIRGLFFVGFFFLSLFFNYLLNIWSLITTFFNRRCKMQAQQHVAKCDGNGAMYSLHCPVKAGECQCHWGETEHKFFETLKNLKNESVGLSPAKQALCSLSKETEKMETSTHG